MIRKAWRTVIRFLGSPALAFSLLGFVGVWSMVATAIPQGKPDAPEVAAWVVEYGTWEAIVRPLGLHQAFTAPLFMACAILLTLSTAVCTWRRTKVAIARARTLREAASTSAPSIADKHDVEIACAADANGPENLAMAARVLSSLGIEATSRDGVLVAASAPWTVWGSSVFHWALLALMLSAFVGNMLRAEGSMSLVVGQTKPDAAASYAFVTTGPWHDWARVRRSVRLEAFEPRYEVDGIDRGAVPTVSILDADGKVLVTQRVYPNMKLHSDSLSINAPGLGLAPTVEFVRDDGSVSGADVLLVDFSQVAMGGTVPVTGIRNAQMTMTVTVPLDTVDGRYAEWIPREQAVRYRVVAPDGAVMLDQQGRVGEIVKLPGGGAVRLTGIGWYSRLSLVDDPTIPFIYGSMIIGMLGLTLSLVARQQLLLATIVDGPDGARLALRLRLWRNSPTNREEIEEELTAALSAEKEGTDS